MRTDNRTGMRTDNRTDMRTGMRTGKPDEFYRVLKNRL
jgi:hypothetical protein